MVSFGRSRISKALRHDSGAREGAESTTAERTHLRPTRRRCGTFTANARRVPDDIPGGATVSGFWAAGATLLGQNPSLGGDKKWWVMLNHPGEVGTTHPSPGCS